jgi:hypothetical protein
MIKMTPSKIKNIKWNNGNKVNNKQMKITVDY